MFCVDPPHLGAKKIINELILQTIPSFTKSSQAKHELIKWRRNSEEEQRSAET